MKNEIANIDEEKFLQLLESNTGMIVKIAKAYTATFHERQDLVNDIIYQLWKSAKNFRGDSAVSTWIYRVSLNTSMNYGRKKKKDSRITYTGDPAPAASVSWLAAGDGEDPDETSLLYKCIDEMEGINKAIILLYLDGNSHEQIAEVMGITKTNVGTRMARIKEFLRKKCNA